MTRDRRYDLAHVHRPVPVSLHHRTARDTPTRWRCRDCGSVCDADNWGRVDFTPFGVTILLWIVVVAATVFAMKGWAL